MRNNDMVEKLKTLFQKYPDRCCIVIVLLAAVLPFLPSLDFGQFVLDDGVYIGQNFLFDLNWTNIKYHLTSKTIGLYSPLVMLSYIPDYAVWGDEFFYCGIRLQNILWHACSMVLFYLILRKLKWRFKDGDDFYFPPLFALFAVVAVAWHPQRIESVVWIAERKDVLIGVLGSAAIYTFIEAYKRDRIPVAAPVLLFISLWGVKPMLVSLPLILTMGFLAAEKKFDWKRIIRFLSGVYIATAIYLLMNIPTYSGVAAQVVSDANPAADSSRISLAAYNILRYFVKTLYPVKLNPLYPLTDPATVSSLYLMILSLIILLIAAAVFFWKEKREFLARTLLPCAFMFGAAVFPVCSLVKIGNVDFADRYSYFPSLFIWAAVAGAAWMFYRDHFEQRRIFSLVILLYSLTIPVMTGIYLPAWRNTGTQLDVILDTPTPHREALKMAAVVEFEKNNLDNALKYVEILKSYNTHLRNDEIFIEGMYGLVEISCGNTGSGIARINNFLSKPDWFMIGNNPFPFIRNCLFASANYHLKRRQIHYAANIYFMLSQLSIGLSKVDQFNFEGVSMMLRGRYAEAENCFIKALAFSPDDGNIKKNLESARRKKAQMQNNIANPAP